VLAGLSGNCALEGPPVQKVNVTLGARVEVAFAVRCLRLGALRVTIETSGVELDPDGYQVDMFSEGANFVTGQPLPAKSVKDVLFTFFTGKRIKVAGEEMSFNHLEKDVIRSKFSDPRVHALNCAKPQLPAAQPRSVSCGQALPAVSVWSDFDDCHGKSFAFSANGVYMFI
jgi:hypothetical protein